MKKTSQLRLTFRDVLQHIHVGQCYQNALVVADIYPQVEYVEGLAFNGERWLPHAWNCVNGDEFDLTFQIHFPHLLYCDRRIIIAGRLEDLEAEGYLFTPGFTHEG
ncbi:hypothetical protein [uncultured Nostoc sp.]|uniref:hypothetical protein n=1 Tax=uncultured Nostoc sp. TaxID=340711 RepID=UPI0035CA3963